jgi:hypothetical protein
VLKQHGTEHGYGWASDRINWSHGKWRISDPAAAQAIFALRNDPDASALMAGEFASDNAAGLTEALGRQPRSADLYFAHFLGLKGASRFLKAADAYPDAAAASAFPREAAANHGIFYRKSGEARSLSQVYGRCLRATGSNGRCGWRMRAAMRCGWSTCRVRPPRRPAGMRRCWRWPSGTGGSTCSAPIPSTPCSPIG